MENKEINIAEILKDKPNGTKLYSSIIGECYLNTANTYIINVKDNYSYQFEFLHNGKYKTDGECVLFPSKSMRDWSKFAWKKGDVLVSNDGKVECIFEKFTDEEYRTFKGKYTIFSNNDGSTDYLGDKELLDTLNYNLADKDDAQCYINTIEERLGGKLNMETLEIEKKLKWVPKPFEKVLVRDSDKGTWSANFFSHMENDDYITINNCDWKGCIPYEGNEKLLGTTDNWEG